MKKILAGLSMLFPVMMATAQFASDNGLNMHIPFEISGMVQHYQPRDGSNFILFRTWDIAGRSKDTSVPVDSRGHFQVQLWQPFEGDVAFMYQQRYIMMYATPGEKIGLEINADTWSGNDNPLQSLSITGRSAAITRSMVDFQYRMRAADLTSTLPSHEIPDEEYASRRMADAEQQLAFLDRYASERNLKGSRFARWCENDIRYNAGHDIAFKCFAGKINRSTDYAQLMKLLKDMPVDSAAAIHNAAYYGFVEMLATDFLIIENVNDSIQAVLSRKKDNDSPAPVKDWQQQTMTTMPAMNADWPIPLRETERYTKGFAKQLMYYNICTSHEYVHNKKDIPEYAKTITDPVLLLLLKDKLGSMRKPFAVYDLVQHIKEYKVDDTLKRRLIKILEAEKGYYVFMDFWGTWCGPCMLEMPHYPAFIGQFTGKPLHFLFFAMQTDMQKANEVKNKYGISGKFISLTDDEASIMNNVLDFSAVPAHFIMDPSGRVVSNGIQNNQVGYKGGIVNKVVVDQINKLMAAH